MGYVEGAIYLALALLMLVPVWAIFFLLRRRYGTGGRAFDIQPVHTVDRDTLSVSLLDSADRPGHCSSCGEPMDDPEYDHCWNCANPVR